MKKLKLFIWNPHINLGGGERLFNQLIPAIAQQSEIEWIRLTVPSSFRFPMELDSKINLFPLMTSPEQIAEIWHLSGNTSLNLNWGDGFSSIEGNYGASWRWCNSTGRLLIHNSSESSKNIVMEMELNTWHQDLSVLRMTSPLFNYQTKINYIPKYVSIPLLVPSGEHSIAFSCDAKPAEAPSDPRTLVFRILSFRIKENILNHFPVNPTSGRQSYFDVRSSYLQFCSMNHADFFSKAWLDQIQRASKDCDLIYVFWPHRQIFPETNKPIVCTFQDTIFFDFPEISGGGETREEWKRANVWIQKSNKVIVSSQVSKRKLIQHFGDRGNSSIVIPHAIMPLSDLVSTGGSLVDLPKDYVVYPANITSHKNHYTLLQGWARFENRKKFPLVLFGGGTDIISKSIEDTPDHWNITRLVSLITRLGLKHREDFFCLGYVDDAKVMPIIRQASALIMPSLAEGGGSFPVEEALHVGTPVLCSDIPVMREQLGGRSAEICWFDPESPDSIARSLHHLFAQYDAIKQKSLKAMSDYRPTWNDVAKEYVEVFQSVV